MFTQWTSISILKVFDFDAAPLPGQVLGNKPPVAVVWFLLAAKKTAAIENFAWRVFNMARPDQVEKLPLVLVPIALLRFLIGIEDVGRRCEFREMHVIDTADRVREIPQIIFLREARKLGCVVQPDIDETPDTGFTKACKKRLCRFPGEPDGEQFQHKSAGRRPTLHERFGYAGDVLPPDLQISRIGRESDVLLRNLLEHYMHDMSEWFEIDTQADGSYSYDTSHVWENDYEAYLAKIGDSIAGFALTGPANEWLGDTAARDMHEFFVLRRFRMGGVGQSMANRLWSERPGEWLVRVLELNAPAVLFWRAAVSGHSGGLHQEEERIVNGRPWRFFRFESHAV
jgi:predicted acetyltransferase